MAAYATVEELVARLDFEPSEDELRLAEAALEDASVLVAAELQHLADSAPPPPLARTIVLAAARRLMVNPSGYSSSKSGDEAVAFADGQQASVYLTPSEIGLLQRLVRPGKAFGTIPLVAWGSKSAERPFGEVDPGYPYRPMR